MPLLIFHRLVPAVPVILLLHCAVICIISGELNE